MRLFKTRNDELEEIIEKVVRAVIEDTTAHAGLVLENVKTIAELEKMKTSLQKEVDRLKETTAAKNREIEHKLGLAKMRMDQEQELRESMHKHQQEHITAMGDVRINEARIAAREEALKRSDEILGEHLKLLERLVNQLVEALPKAKISARISERL